MIGRSVRVDLENALGDGIRFDVPMARCTSLRIGGPADALAKPAHRGELARLSEQPLCFRIATHLFECSAAKTEQMRRNP